MPQGRNARHGECSQQYRDNCTVASGYQIYCDAHTVRCINVESLCHTPKTNIVCHGRIYMYIDRNVKSRSEVGINDKETS